MNAAQVADFIQQAVDARLAVDGERLAELLDALMAGPTAAPAYEVTATLAAAIGEGLSARPGEDFVRFPDQLRRCEEGEGLAPLTADDLPPWTATFLRMAVAVANQDRTALGALFTGYVSHRRGNAMRLVLAGVTQLAHALTCQDCTPPGLRVQRWA